ncbi:MAG: MogA/MoaB family molybdenum cofactor biosynthesis protein [Thermoplasmatota archaeon]
MTGAPAEHRAHAPRRALGFAILVVSDTRTLSTESSGKLIASLVEGAKHRVVERSIAPDETKVIAEHLASFLANPEVDVIVTTGGTGAALRDVTLEAARPLFAKEFVGFGELFRTLSYSDIGAAAWLSRATAGATANGRVLFILPGAPRACELAMTRLVLPEIGHLIGVMRPETRT